MRALLDKQDAEQLRLDAIDEVFSSQPGLGAYVLGCTFETDTCLYTTQELADICNWELGTYERKMTELLSAEYYSKHGCNPPEENNRPVYPRYMLQIMQSHLERKFG